MPSTDRTSLAVADGDAPAARWVQAHGPASLSNLGPGFDALGLCLSGLGDDVSARRADRGGVHIEHIEGGPPQLGLDAERNTAAVAARAVLDRAGAPFGAVLRLRKRVPFGSGVGGSAASAVAGAWAVNALLDDPFAKADLVEAVLAGEAVASGCLHGDNVLPALFGGLVLVSATEPTRYRRVEAGGMLHVALLLPEIEILTKEARGLLPERVGLREAVHNAAALAFLVDAFCAGDWEEVGRSIMSDRLVEPIRARLVPCYHPVREAALKAGAFGCALTGSGPAMFALAPTAARAEHIAHVMTAAAREVGVEGTPLTSTLDPHGATLLDAGE